MVKVGNTKKLCLTQLMVIMSASMSDKLNCEKLLQAIDTIAKDLHIEWAVELCGEKELLAVSRIADEDIINDEVLHKLEEDATTFYNAVNEMNMLEPECPSHEEVDDTQRAVDMMKQIVNDINDGDEVCAILGIGVPPIFIGRGVIKSPLLKEMCELYLEKYGKQ
jgi:hypothetical protein